ncbi:MAG: TlpA disulfide reductase family protein [Synergistaceae bacterium]
MKKATLFTTGFLAFVFAFIMMVSSSYAMEVGDNAKDFVLQSNIANGKKISLSDYKGKKIILNFWASWCPPCRGEMPEFDEMDKEFKKKNDTVMLAVNMTDGQRETIKKAETFIKEKKYGLTVLYDVNSTAAVAYKVQYLPTTYVIGKDGKIAGKIVGGTTKAAVMELLNKAK